MALNGLRWNLSLLPHTSLWACTCAWRNHLHRTHMPHSSREGAEGNQSLYFANVLPDRREGGKRVGAIACTSMLHAPRW